MQRVVEGGWLSAIGTPGRKVAWFMRFVAAVMSVSCGLAAHAAHEVLLNPPSGVFNGQTWQPSPAAAIAQQCALNGMTGCYFTDSGGYRLADQSGSYVPFGITGYNSQGERRAFGYGWAWQYRTVPDPMVIALSGPSSTHYLPAGPGVQLIAKVTNNGAPASGQAVKITVRGVASNGVTDANGELPFTYTPPQQLSGTTLLEPVSATCTSCSNVATKTISVEPSLAPPEPQTCSASQAAASPAATPAASPAAANSAAPAPAPLPKTGAEILALLTGAYTPPPPPPVQFEPGSSPFLWGDPINVVTGENRQYEFDWMDQGTHPLPFARRYGSYGNDIPAAGLGSRWTHNWMGRLSIDGSQAKVALGVDGNVLFVLDAATGAWLAQGNGDTLAQLPAGFEYLRAGDQSRWLFAPDGRLQAVTARNGWQYTLAYDGAGRLTTVTNAFGRSLQFAYDGSGALLSVTVPGGSSFTYGQDASGRLASVTRPDGAVESFLYEDSRWPQGLTGVVAPDGTRSSFTYDAQGRATSTQRGAQTYSVTYAQPTRPDPVITVGTQVDPGAYQGVSYVTDPLGTQRVLSWQGGNGSVQLASSDRPLPGSQVASRSIGAGQLVAAETDFLGVQTLYTWDANRRLPLSTTRAANRPEAQTQSVHWHPTLRLPATITRDRLTTSYNYDAVGNMLTRTVTDTTTGEARTWSWTYDSRGLAIGMTDPRGASWSYSHDGAGNVSAVTDPLHRTIAFTYDGAGRMLTKVEPGGLQTTYAYDVLGRVVSMAQGDTSASFTYTAAGQLQGIAISDGYRIGYSYDAGGRLAGVTDNLGSSIAYALDAAGNVVRQEVRGAGGAIEQVVSQVIDSLNRVTAVQGSLGQTTQIGYDANGVPVSVTDPLNQTTRQTIDGLQRNVATTLPDGAGIAQSWSALDDVTQVRDPKGVATQFTYNAFGEVLSETSPDAGTIVYTRDAAGNVTQMRDAKGQIRQIERDALGRIARIQYSADQQVAFTYDPAGHVVAIDDSSGGTTLERDAQGRITRKTQRVNDNPTRPSQYQVRYAYSNGDLVGMTYPSGLQVTYQRSAGRIVGIDVQLPGKAAVSFVSNLAQSALGQPLGWTWFNGDTASRSFDTDGRMTANEFASYSYDAGSRITSITQQLLATRSGDGFSRVPVTWLAGYDSRDRLVSFDRAGAQTHYTYDPNSNRLTSMQTVSGDSDLDMALNGDHRSRVTSQAQNIDADSNRLLGFTQTATTLQNDKTRSVVTTPITYGIDANGSMTSDGLRTFEYDASGRLTKVRLLRDGEPATVSYLHNALGQRVFKSELQSEFAPPREDELGTGFTAWLRQNFGWLFTAPHDKSSLGQAFVYGDEAVPAWALLGEYDNGSREARGSSEYIWLPTEDGGAIPVGIYKNGSLYAVHSDHLGTPRLVTDERNKPVWQWPYSAFGNNEPIGWLAGSSGKRSDAPKPVKPLIELNLRFQGQYADAETGLAFNLNRSYLASQGRYVQSDPIGLAGGISRFSYVLGAPTLYSDPSGLQTSLDSKLKPYINQLLDGGGGGGGFAGGGSGRGSWSGGNAVSPPFGSVGNRGNGMADGVGVPSERFTGITKPGPMTIEPLPNGGTRISGDLIGGGTSNIRFNPDGTVRVDAHPDMCRRITEHWN